MPFKAAVTWTKNRFSEVAKWGKGAVETAASWGKAAVTWSKGAYNAVANFFENLFGKDACGNSKFSQGFFYMATFGLSKPYPADLPPATSGNYIESLETHKVNPLAFAGYKAKPKSYMLSVMAGADPPACLNPAKYLTSDKNGCPRMRQVSGKARAPALFA